MNTPAKVSIAAENGVERLNALDWRRISQELDNHGSVVLERLASADECRALAAIYLKDEFFRRRVVMGRHGFGRGEYKYFNYPLPDVIAELRTGLYPRLAPVANWWNAAMGIEIRYPEKHTEFIQRCHDAGQVRPTPLLLQYGEGDYNCLHQDLYGEHVFSDRKWPSAIGTVERFYGWRICADEQRPRMQSRPEVVPLRQGDAVAFAVHHRPIKGTRGFYRVHLRHGVSRLRWGQDAATRSALFFTTQNRQQRQ